MKGTKIMRIIKCNEITVYDYASKYLEELELIDKDIKMKLKNRHMLEVEAMKKAELQSLNEDTKNMKIAELKSLKNTLKRN